MPHLLVAGKLHHAGETLLQDLKSRSLTYDYVEEVSEPSYAPLIHKADALVIRTQPLCAQTIAQGASLRVVSRHGVGYDSVDLKALNARGIALTIAGDVNSISVAEHAMMQLLASAKRVLRADSAVRGPGHWNWRDRLEQHEISGKRLLILGYGRTGQHLARMAAGFHMQIRACDPRLEELGWPGGPVHPISLTEGLGWADFLSVHIPRDARPAIGAEEIAQMKPGAVLVNTARGGIVDEVALANALRSGHLGAAGIDVFDEEPPGKDSPLLTCDNALLSPHIAGVTEESSERMAIASIRNALDYLDGSIDPDLIVNKEALNVQT